MNSTVALYPHHPYAGYRFESNNTRFYSHHHHQQQQQQQQQNSPPDETFDDEDQIPSVDEFRAIIDDYLNNLSPKKRDKALVDQTRYVLIQQVLRDPRNTAISTAQFRFWVKKMFQLQPGTTDLVCHDNKPVAMKEQIYDILVKAHREAHHGGRDKTSALVRRRFSWIPKELVARFVRHCPFCITRRNSGHSPSTLLLKNSSPRSRYSRHGCSFDSTGAPTICTPSSLKEESDLSSGPPSSDSGYEATPNYVTMSSSPSPRRPYFSSMYDRDDNDFLECHYEPSFNINSSFRSNNEQRNMHPLNHSQQQQQQQQQQSHQQQQQHQQQQHPQPQSPLFYSQNYSGYPFYSTGYYPNALGITPCGETNNTTSPTSAATSTASSAAAAAAAAAAVALMRSPNTDLLSHTQEQYSAPYVSNYSSMPENAYGADI
ncbi:hypothetical protein INT47_011219 [Mucor saturninus]|uniref:Integrase zinc-binding domain-containing protein n=1 Tax=Mucor saturninus TaxID=64648 RepID=A0A8H7RM37_9FUNG|nr:hypothetical protein INT47_011219 [Mucor saturninus]